MKGHPGYIPGEIETWSGTQGVWKNKAFILSPLCFLHQGGFDHISAISLPHLPCPSGLPSGTLIRAALLQSNTTHLTEILQGLPRSWELALSNRYGACNWNSVMFCIHLPLIWKSNQLGNSHVTGQLPAWCVTTITRNSSLMMMLFD